MNQTISVEKENIVQMNRKTESRISVRMVTMVALLSAISYILAFIELSGISGK